MCLKARLSFEERVEVWRQRHTSVKNGKGAAILSLNLRIFLSVTHGRCDMEPAQYFSLLVLLVCGIHLIAGISACIEARWPASAQKSAQAVHGVLAAAGQRSDWYVFFHCSDLVGKEPEKSVFAGPDKSYVQHTRQPAPRRRQSRLILP